MSNLGTGQIARAFDPRGYIIIADTFENTQLPNNYKNYPITLPQHEEVLIVEARTNQHNEKWYRVKHFNPKLTIPEFVWVWESCLQPKENKQ